ncbi:MAG: GTPase HflX [Gemmatimonadetes bacterium]|nr:GTPase HflX [Gemmatimonadota bacterium]MBK8061909.1 GTPase HflX [Gemmatimonadota bacterium]MBK9978674.1 GTPase HflX [Gemmatimonadota bacterium]
MTPPVERAILVGAPRKGTQARHHVDEHLEELERLADTAGAQVIGRLTQQIDRPHPGTYLGKGKIDELRQRVSDEAATLVIFDDELSPAQGKNIEELVGKRVMDRAELILDIFATRARSREAKMQVELAQLTYMLPRLTRMWTHLEKFRGGIGMRGPGETQLETDRRLIGHRIRVLKERLAEVQRTREVQRHGRRGEFRAALVGYTNAGKSSILRAMSGSDDIFVEDRLFATLDPLSREVDLGEGQRVVLTDTVGFIRKLPHHLVASFRATLEELHEADLLLHVIDASHPSWEEQREVVDDVIADLGAHEKPMLYVFNKSDNLSPGEVEGLGTRVQHLFPHSVVVSSVAPGGLDPLREVLRERVRRFKPMVELRLGHGDGKLLAELHRTGEVLAQRHTEEGMFVQVRLDEAALGRALRAGASVVGAGTTAGASA